MPSTMWTAASAITDRPDYALDRTISKSGSRVYEIRGRYKAVKSRVKPERTNHLSSTGIGRDVVVSIDRVARFRRGPDPPTGFTRMHTEPPPSSAGENRCMTR